MNIRPLADRVLVELEPLETKTKGGLHLPDEVVYKQNLRPDARYGKVLAVGPGKDTKKGRREVSVRPGQRVLINGWMNDSLKGHGYGGRNPNDNHVMVSEADILAVDEGDVYECTGDSDDCQVEHDCCCECG